MVIPPEVKARIHPLMFDHINFNGRYTITRPELGGSLRPLRDPAADDEDN
jgi:hypothetical protein